MSPLPLPLLLSAAILCATLPAARAAESQPQADTVLGAADLERLQAEMANPSTGPAQRLAAARTVELADREGFRIYAAYLARPLVSAPATIKRLIHAVWGQYPNPDYPRGPGKDPPMWLVRPEPPPPPVLPGTPRSKRPKPPKPHDPEAADWLTGLAQLDLEHDSFMADLQAQSQAELRLARAEMLMRVALLHALGNAGKQGARDAVAAVFQFAFVADGLFRDECGRTLRGMGGHAVPTLIRIYNDRTRANAKMRRYASYQLDRMDRLRPAKAISAAPDDVVRADILRAYGEVLALDAVEAVLEQVGSRSHRVRREARWAWLRYVDGPPPPPAPKRKRKLPGGKEESEEKEDYLNYREMAILALGRTYQQLFSREPDGKLSPRQITDEIWAYYDRQSEQQFEQVFKSGQAHEQKGERAEAVAAFGWILANQPDHPRRAEMAMAFARLGEELARTGEEKQDPALRARALGLLRQALLLRQDTLDKAGDGREKDAAAKDELMARLCARIHLLDSAEVRRLGGDGRLDAAGAKACQQGESSLTAPLRPQESPWRFYMLPWLLLGVGLVFSGSSIALALSRRRVLPPAQ